MESLIGFFGVVIGAIVAVCKDFFWNGEKGRKLGSGEFNFDQASLSTIDPARLNKSHKRAKNE
jgi:hypothetical protein